MADEKLQLVRVVGPDFVAGFETDGTVRRAAPILKALVGMTDAEAREHIKAKGWTARRRHSPGGALRPAVGLVMRLLPRH